VFGEFGGECPWRHVGQDGWSEITALDETKLLRAAAAAAAAVCGGGSGWGGRFVVVVTPKMIPYVVMDRLRVLIIRRCWDRHFYFLRCSPLPTLCPNHPPMLFCPFQVHETVFQALSIKPTPRIRMSRLCSRRSKSPYSSSSSGGIIMLRSPSLVVCAGGAVPGHEPG